jgi:hypothetical protein
MPADTIITDIRRAAERLTPVFPLPNQLDQSTRETADAAVGGVAGRSERQSEQFVHIDHDAHLLGGGVELDEMRVAAVGRRADVDFAVLALAQRKID